MEEYRPPTVGRTKKGIHEEATDSMTDQKNRQPRIVCNFSHNWKQPFIRFASSSYSLAQAFAEYMPGKTVVYIVSWIYYIENRLSQAPILFVF